MTRRQGMFLGLISTIFTLGALAVGAPYLGVEFLLRRNSPIVSSAKPVLIRGRWADDYFVVENIDEGTFAIGEPRYYQGNYSYLLVGRARALLFDAGTGSRDIVPVVRSLTALPVTVIPSHLHFDHVGALGRFERTALLDLPELRARADGGRLTLQRYEFLGFGDDLPPPRFAVDEWWADGARIDLGGRSVQVLATPGHTLSSVSLLDREHRLLLAGDFLYPGPLYAFVPGASRARYLATTRQLLRLLDPATRILTAHMAEDPAGARAPLMECEDLRALEHTLLAIDTGRATSTGWFPRIYPVRGAMTFAIGFAWNGR